MLFVVFLLSALVVSKSTSPGPRRANAKALGNENEGIYPRFRRRTGGCAPQERDGSSEAKTGPRTYFYDVCINLLPFNIARRSPTLGGSSIGGYFALIR